MIGRRKQDALGNSLRAASSYVSITSFAGSRHRVIQQGQVFPGNDPVVQGSPGRFVPVGTPQADIQRIKIARTMVDPGPSTGHKRQPAAYVCKRGFRYGYFNIERGTEVPEGHPLLKIHPAAFRPIESPSARDGEGRRTRERPQGVVDRSLVARGKES